MAIYPCGDDTGEYYLIISGLPWSATWQKLKDFVRYPESGSVINVDHVFIYPSATDGWIRIYGKEEFQKAYEYLNGRVFEGKAIVADDRNGYTIVNLRDMAPILTSVSRREHHTGLPPQKYHAQHPYRPQALPSPRYGPYDPADSYSMRRLPTLDSQQDLGSNGQLVCYSPASTSSQVTTQTGYSTNYDSCASYGTQCTYGPTKPLSLASPPAGQAPVYAQQMQIGYGPCLVPVGPVSQLIRTPPPPPPTTSYQYPTAQDNQHVIQTDLLVQSDPRKIIICQLPYSTTDKELQSLLERATRKSKSRSGAPPQEYSIYHFEIVRHPDGRSKGYAFATFTSAAIARRAVEALDGRKFHNRELKVKRTKEGIESIYQPSAIEAKEMYSAPALSHSLVTAEVTAQMENMSMTVSTNTAHSTTENKRERRDKGTEIARSQERGYDADNERHRSAKSRSGHHSTRALTITDIEHDRRYGTKSSQSMRGPLVVDGSTRRRHR